MKIKINLWSFIFSFVCISLFFISILSSKVFYFETNFAHIHPLKIVLIISLVTHLFGLIGFSEAITVKLLLRSIFTVITTLVLSVLILFIICLGNLFQFT